MFFFYQLRKRLEFRLLYQNTFTESFFTVPEFAPPAPLPEVYTIPQTPLDGSIYLSSEIRCNYYFSRPVPSVTRLVKITREKFV